MTAFMQQDTIDPNLPLQESEFTLSTSTLLGIFLGLALVCGVFFGFGYSIGRNTDTVPPKPSDVSQGLSTTFEDPQKNEANTAQNTVASAPAAEPALPTASTVPSSPTPAIAAKPSAAVRMQEQAGQQQQAFVPAPEEKAVPPIRTPQPVAPAPVAATAAATGQYFVQIAAVTRASDAAYLTGSLRKSGIVARARNLPGDSLIHVQVGPFDSADEARAAQQKLKTKGYNAIIKH